MRVALVLGAGGAAGWAFHLGVVRAISSVSGHDPAHADLIIGTSAGATIAASLKAGADISDILAATTRPPSAEDQAAMRRHLGQARSHGWRRLQPLAPGLGRHALPGGRGIGLAAAGLLPAGLFPTGALGRFPGVEGLDAWPDGLWITSVRVHDGKVVVFGRDRTDVPVSLALQASAAVPGMFHPTEIDGRAHVDGATASPTHADLAAEIDPDIVVISSVMTRPGRRPFRIAARRRLADERRALDEAGIRAVVIEPDDHATELFKGFPRSGRTSAQHLADTGSRLTLAALGTRP